MDYKFESNLGWDNGVSTHHKANLELGLDIEDFLEGRDIAATLQAEQDSVRQEIHRAVMEEIVPKILTKAGANPVEGELNTDTQYKTKAHAKLGERRTSRGVDVYISDKLSIDLDIKTDRSVTALEAIHGSGHAIGDAITNDVMMHLAHKYLGIVDHSITSKSEIRNNKLAHHEATHLDASDQK